MNLILLFDSDFIDPHTVCLTDRRFLHIRDVLKVKVGQSLTVGKADGLIGQGTLVVLKPDAAQLEIQLNQKPPAALVLTLILALPRPPILKRILFTAAMLGVKKIIILNFNRVEKALWSSSVLRPDAIKEQLILGLEQSKDTVMPEVLLEKKFKPFVEDKLPSFTKGKLALVAHPERIGTSPIYFSSRGDVPILLIIGPEGGILDYELSLLQKAGCRAIDLGPRILRTETVLPFMVGKLFCQFKKEGRA